MSLALAPDGRTLPGAGSFGAHARETAAIAAPVALALLAEMAMGLISTIMLGNLGERALAAGGLGTSLFFTCLIVLQGVLSGVGVLAANRLGGGRAAEVPGIYWTGMALAGLCAVPLFLLLSDPRPLLAMLREPPALAADVAAFLHALRWGAPAGMVGVGMMRQFLPAVGLERVLVWVMPGGVALHLAANIVLIHGAFGLPGLGMAGAALATVCTLWALAAGLLAMLHGRGSVHALVAFTRPRLRLLAPLLAIGAPVGATVAVEAGLFLAAGLMAGDLGTTVLAAHMVALNVASVIFMVPLAISQAANVRVAAAAGAGNRAAARRAGLSAIGLSLGVMSLSAFGMEVFPAAITALYLGSAQAAPALLATRLLRVAGLFQLADGTQVTAAGALRGLQDTSVPMLLAAFGYWGIGFWAGRYLAFDQGLGAVGLWWGLCAGLAAVAACLGARFVARS